MNHLLTTASATIIKVAAAAITKTYLQMMTSCRKNEKTLKSVLIIHITLL